MWKMYHHTYKKDFPSVKIRLSQQDFLVKVKVNFGDRNLIFFIRIEFLSINFFLIYL